MSSIFIIFSSMDAKGIYSTGAPLYLIHLNSFPGCDLLRYDLQLWLWFECVIAVQGRHGGEKRNYGLGTSKL